MVATTAAVCTVVVAGVAAVVVVGVVDAVTGGDDCDVCCLLPLPWCGCLSEAAADSEEASVGPAAVDCAALLAAGGSSAATDADEDGAAAAADAGGGWCLLPAGECAPQHVWWCVSQSLC